MTDTEREYRALVERFKHGTVNVERYGTTLRAYRIDGCYSLQGRLQLDIASIKTPGHAVVHINRWFVQDSVGVTAREVLDYSYYQEDGELILTYKAIDAKFDFACETFKQLIVAWYDRERVRQLL